jgi:hypothetical protein
MKTAFYRTELSMRLFLPEDETQEKVLHIRQELQVGKKSVNAKVTRIERRNVQL